MPALPEVSVVLTTFNGETRGFLAAAIESVLAQSFVNFEMLLVDDGSTDGTATLCERYLADLRVRYISQKNLGVAAARNTGVSHARADLVCFLDDDDRWKADKLQKQVALFREGPANLGLVYTAIEVIDPRGRIVGIQRHPVPRDAYRGLFFENFVDATSSVMARREAIVSVGSFRADIYAPPLQACEDRDLWLRIARSYSIQAIPEPLVIYQLHAQRLSRNLEQMERGEMKLLELAFLDAPPDILARREEIVAIAIHRTAMEYFGIADYAHFRDRVRILARSGRSTRGLWARYVFSFSPALTNSVRWLARQISLPKRNMKRPASAGFVYSKDGQGFQ